jgi:hypothetical protein
MMEMRQMTPAQNAELKQVVDLSGWDGARKARPDLWQAFLAERKHARKVVDESEKEEFRRVGA